MFLGPPKTALSLLELFPQQATKKAQNFSDASSIFTLHNSSEFNSHQLHPKGEVHPHIHAVRARVRAQGNPGRVPRTLTSEAPLGRGPRSDMCTEGTRWRMGEDLHFLRLSITVCMFNIQHFGGSEGTNPSGRPRPGSGINDQHDLEHDLEQHT